MIQEYSIELKDRHHEYLQEMIEKYSVEDLGKAIRILIDHAIDAKDMETVLWEDERCLDCD